MSIPANYSTTKGFQGVLDRFVGFFLLRRVPYATQPYMQVKFRWISNGSYIVTYQLENPDKSPDR